MKPALTTHHLDSDWLTNRDGRRRTRARAVIGHRPSSVGIKAAVGNENFSCCPATRRSGRRAPGLNGPKEVTNFEKSYIPKEIVRVRVFCSIW